MKKNCIIDMCCDPRLERQPSGVPPATIRLWEYCASIVEGMTASWTEEDCRTTPVPCRRRPGRKPCAGYIVAWIDEEHLEWACTHCGDAGLVLNCWGGSADLSRNRVDGQFGADWLAAILRPDEYRALADPKLGFEPKLVRIIRAARVTRPGIRIEAPRPMWDPLIFATAERALERPSTPARRLLRKAWSRFCDARNLHV